jgi:hypothetical protein
MGTIRCVPRGWLVTTVVCCLVRLARSDNELGLDGSCAAAELISSAQCGLYMAESAIPGSGLGMFAAIPIRANQRIFYGDVVVNVEDFPLNIKLRNWFYQDFTSPVQGWLLDSYFWNPTNTLGLHEADDVQSIIPGLGMLANSHTGLVNAVTVAPQRVEDLHRGRDPGAGASTTFHDHHFISAGDIEAGAELFVAYGDSWFRDRKDLGMIPLSTSFKKADRLLEKFHSVVKGDINSTLASDVWELTLEAASSDPRLTNALPRTIDDVERVHQIGTAKNSVPDRVRSLDWLKKNGRCLDNIKPGMSTIHQAGRGAFATRAIPKGSVVAPLPLVHLRRHHMEVYNAEGLDDPDSQVWRLGTQLLLNYCYGHRDSSLLLFPYAPVVNYVNHHKTAYNIELQWSSHPSQHAEWLKRTPDDLDREEHAGLLMELIATRDISAGEEIFLNYGDAWDEDWNQFLSNLWNPSEEDKEYLSAAALNLRSEALLTVDEQKVDPYVANVMIGCFIGSLDENSESPDGVVLREWTTTPDMYHDADCLYECEIVERSDKEKYYTVRVAKPNMKVKVLVGKVPREAIQFFDTTYTSDLFLRDAFRNEIQIPEAIFPSAWRDLKA